MQIKSLLTWDTVFSTDSQLRPPLHHPSPRYDGVYEDWVRACRLYFRFSWLRTTHLLSRLSGCTCLTSHPTQKPHQAPRQAVTWTDFVFFAWIPKDERCPYNSGLK